MANKRIGIWLIGAKGGVATTTIVGLTTLKKGLIGSAGLVSQLPQFESLDLADWADMVVGGHEIRDVSLIGEATKLVTESHTASQEWIDQCRDELEQIDRRIRPGCLLNVGQTIEDLAAAEVPRDASPRAAVKRLREDLDQFVRSEQLDRLVVVNVASTEPPADPASIPPQWSKMEPMLDDPQCPLPASSLYAIAALESGHAYVNFTPSLGSSPAAIDELARLRGTCHIGRDGKTGETLMKSVLAPMFARRNLRIMSWVGHNIFGNMDGKVLKDPDNKRAKVDSKDHLIHEILGYRPQTHVSIEYIESLGDWKTAWDHVHFTGFLGVPMSLQFTWQGCDSVLAAPLVLDLTRFTDLAARRGQTGELTFLASFFKSPQGVDEHCFDRQFQMLEQWAEGMKNDE
ncbi:MAG: inositol-3-phosphate synthase [Candidatus Nealsonbacteria bacterium]|nr:inositol-3-phosphate synthase [Candidatus Nealsonbacteria bacterium]